MHPHKIRRLRRILHHPPNIRRQPIQPHIIRPHHMHLHPRLMPQLLRKLFIRQKHTPHTPLVPHHRSRPPIPRIKIPNQPQRLRLRRPLPIPRPAPPILRPPIQPKILMPRRHFPRRPPMLLQHRPKMLIMLKPIPQPPRIRLQPRIQRNQPRPIIPPHRPPRRTRRRSRTAQTLRQNIHHRNHSRNAPVRTPPS